MVKKFINIKQTKSEKKTLSEKNCLGKIIDNKWVRGMAQKRYDTYFSGF